MINGFYSAACAMEADMMKMEVIANNIANINTPGFKKEYVTCRSPFSDEITRQISSNPSRPDFKSGFTVDEMVTDYSNGDIIYTGNPLDLCLNTEGFFTIQTPSGLAYTRNGSLQLNEDGILTTRSGFPVMGQNGEISINPGADFEISSTGKILQNGNPVDQLKVVDFAQPYNFQRAGGNLFFAQEGTEPLDVEFSSIQPHHLESSNVSSIGVVNEMVNMIKTNRHFEANQRIVSMQDTLLGSLINKLTQT